MSRPVALVLAAPGTNRDRDVATALSLAGADPQIRLVGEVVDQPTLLDDADLVVVPGGFSHADALGAGRVFGLSLALRLGDQLREFVARGGPVIGICNGFQTLVRAGLLPGALGHNASGRFQCEWVTLVPEATTSSSVSGTQCIWTRDVEPFDCPIAHGEGRYVHPDIASLAAAGQVALRYETNADGSVGRNVNPNGSAGDIAGVCDETGLVLGLMPHPENHVVARQHPRARAGDPSGHGRALGLQLFERGVAHARDAKGARGVARC